MKKIIVVILLLLIIIGTIFYGLKRTEIDNFFNQSNNITQNGDVSSSIESTDTNITENPNLKSESIYYIYDQTFMGSLENNTWYTPIETKDNIQIKKWNYQQFLSIPFFTVYNNLGNSVDLDLLKTTLSPGIGCFFPVEHISFKNEFKKYSIYNKYTNIDSFFLPVTLSGDIKNLSTDFINSTIYFDNANDILMTNQKSIIKFAQPNEETEITENVNLFLRKYIKDNNILPEIDYTCVTNYLHDINNDDKLDHIYVFQSSDANMNETEKRISRIKAIGSFVLIVADLGNRVEVIYDYAIEREAPQEKLETYQQINRIDIIDINGDEIYECCFVLDESKGKQKYIAQYSNDSFKLILKNILSQ